MYANLRQDALDIVVRLRTEGVDNDEVYKRVYSFLSGYYTPQEVDEMAQCIEFMTDPDNCMVSGPCPECGVELVNEECPKCGNTWG